MTRGPESRSFQVPREQVSSGSLSRHRAGARVLGDRNLTVTNETITIRITDMNGSSYLVVLQGVEKNSSLSTEYGAIFGGINQGPRALITFGSGDNSYQWKTGTLKVEELDPKTGAFRAKIINGKAVNARNSVNGELVDVEFEVDMRFENIVNLTNSPF